MINNNKAKDIFNNVLATAEKNGDKFWIGRSLRNIGIIFYYREDSIALNYYNRSLEIANSNVALSIFFKSFFFKIEIICA